MEQPILSLDELKELGFYYAGKGKLDGDDFYRWWSFRKNNSQIDVTYEFNSKFEFISGYIDFNSEKLNGRTLTKKDIELLIEIM